MDIYRPEMVYYLRHPQWVEKALYNALEDVANHAGLRNQFVGTEMRLYSSQDWDKEWDRGANVDLVLWPKAVMTWEM